MRRFRYRAVDGQGREMDGFIAAADRDEAVRRLQARGLVLLAADPAPSGSVGSIARQARFFSDLALLLSGGATLADALEMMSTSSERWRSRAARTLLQGLRRGERFSHVLAEGGWLPYAVAVCRAGEEGGRLAEAMSDLAAYLGRRQELRRKLLSALTYPLLLLAVAGVAVMVLLGFVMPSFQRLFADAGVPLPLATRGMMAAASFLADFLLPLLLAALAGGFCLHLWRRDLFPGLWARLSPELPVLGPLLREVLAERFARALAHLLRGGVALEPASALAAAAMDNAFAEVRLRASLEKLRQGLPLSAALRGVPPLPPDLAEMAAIGENSGRLADALSGYADFTAAQVAHRAGRMLALAEPLAILFLGGMVGTIVLSMLAAILGVNALAQ